MAPENEAILTWATPRLTIVSPGREAFEDLHPGAVGRAQLDFPFDVCFRIELHENRVDALVLRYGAERNGQRFGPGRREQKDLDERAGDHLSAVVELERDGNVGRRPVRALADRQQPSAHLGERIDAAVVRRFEIGARHGAQSACVFLRHFRSQYELAVLRNGCKRLAYRDVVSFADRQALDEAAMGAVARVPLADDLLASAS